ncbi:uncharacterized protein LOC123988876 [Osmia bicornis bicornis]|uniref:uncharacterized protein LOC123988876 n=2 Tax=Osmia bicornis bicornis TaxID=1437191 RepID=UPI001EAF2B78|nr:uncharacterized protein LOC123988876 [Osmia bicornis bicornis]
MVALERGGLFRTIESCSSATDGEGQNSAREKTKIRNEEREVTMRKWQEEWVISTKGRWTYRLIPKIDEWQEWGPKILNYHLTQVLTGHGCFGTYLKEIGKADTDVCWFCQDATDDPEHFLLNCTRWERQRKKMTDVVGTFVMEDLVKILKEPEKRPHVMEFLVAALLDKEKWERENIKNKEKAVNSKRQKKPYSKRMHVRINPAHAVRCNEGVAKHPPK